MGYGVQTLPKLFRKLELSPKDWCLVAIHDPENPSRAGRELERLLDDLDEDSGEFFDFYLPGYEDGRDSSGTRQGHDPHSIGQDRFLDSGLRPAPGKDSVRWSDRAWRFDHRLFRDFVMGIEHLPHNQWRYNGDCSFLLFQTFRRPEFRPDSFWDLSFVAEYNLDDIVLNGQAVNQFLRRMCLQMEGIGRSDVSTVKNGLDEVYRELIMPPENRTPEQELRLREGTSRLLRSHPEREYVFISYSTKDRERADDVRSLLESTNVRCWMAPRDIPSSSNYAYVIERAISNCAIFLLLVSRNSVRSVWVQKEILYALGKLQQEERVHAAWLDAPFNLEETRSGMAFALQDVQIDECLSKGDPSSIFLRFLTKGIRTPGGWARLLSKAPHFAIHCDKWDQFSTGDWLDLLRARPEFADKCDIWSRFSAGDWERLLLVRPELAHYREKGKN